MYYRVFYGGMGTIWDASFPKSPEEYDDIGDSDFEFPTFKFFKSYDEAIKHINKVWVFEKPLLDKINDDGSEIRLNVSDNLKRNLKTHPLY